MPFFFFFFGEYHIVNTNIKGGEQALPPTIGTKNMGLLNCAGQSFIDGNNNVLIGNLAGNAFVSEIDNVVIGYRADPLVTSFTGAATVIGSNSLNGVSGH